jgi:EAL domain-containing protein (putative c-di-GMP-specific phosphodiesterase class I)
MNSRSWPMVAVMALSACAAVGCSIYVLSGGIGGQYVVAALGICIALSALSSIVLSAVMATSNEGLRHQIRADVAGFERKLRDDRLRYEAFSHDLADLRETSHRTNASLAAGFGELREGYSTLSEQLRSTVSTVTNFHTARSYVGQMQRPSAEYAQSAEAASFAPPPQYDEDEVTESHAGHSDQMNLGHYTQDEVTPIAAETSSNVDQLVVSLEPVIDLFTTKTSHYRLHLGMVKPEGGEVEHDVLLHHADRTGLRAEFDVFAAREAMQLLQHLRQRDPALNIFMSIGASTLQSASALGRILEERHALHDIADGLVLEIPHAMLAGLSDTGLEGLALLARSGVTLSLANAVVTGIDLVPLAKLNVRYLSLSAAAAGGPEGPSPAMISFTQSARAARIHAIITGVVDRRIVPRLTKITRFACGPAFADPRRVKSEAVRNGRSNVGLAA